MRATREISTSFLFTAIVVIDTNIKNNVVISILHTYIYNNPITKTIHHIVHITSSKAKLFTIRYSINQVSNWDKISKIIVIMLGIVHTGVEVCKMDLEMSRLVEWPWLQLMCCTAYLSYSHNFRWWKEVWDENECWLVCYYSTPEIEFNKNYLHQLSD